MLPGPLLYVLQRSSCYYAYTQEERDYGMFQLNRCVFYCFGALCQQERSITSSNVGYSIVHLREETLCPAPTAAVCWSQHGGSS